jgi:hypothetical protein
MRIFGKTIGEYLRLAAGVIALVVVVGVARLALSLAGVPVSAIKFVSVTTMALLGVVYFGVRTHTSGFGSYRQLLPLMVITLGAGSGSPGSRSSSPSSRARTTSTAFPNTAGAGRARPSFTHSRTS